MNKRFYKNLIPIAITITLLSSCSEKSKCELPTSHVHKYTKEITDEITIQTYKDQEFLNSYGYHWNEEHIEINKVDEEVYKIIGNKGLFEGCTNWEYLFNTMASKKDYLKFFYEYDVIETYYEKDSDGNSIPRTRKVHYDGWTTNPYDPNNTGRTRLYHHKFYGYRIICENGKFKLEQSELVDDVREVINSYPYFTEDFDSEVYETFRFSRFELGSLSVEDFDVFEHPDLNNPNLELGPTRIK